MFGCLFGLELKVFAYEAKASPQSLQVQGSPSSVSEQGLEGEKRLLMGIRGGNTRASVAPLTQPSICKLILAAVEDVQDKASF